VTRVERADRRQPAFEPLHAVALVIAVVFGVLG